MKYVARCVYGGIYEKEVEVHVDKRLVYLPSGQCGVRIKEDDKQKVIDLISYESTVLRVTYNKAFDLYIVDSMPCPIDYSVTTTRHVNRFLKEYLPSVTYHELKEAFKYNGAVWVSLYDGIIGAVIDREEDWMPEDI